MKQNPGVTGHVNREDGRRVVWVTSVAGTNWKTGGEKYSVEVRSYLEQNGWNVVVVNLPTEVSGSLLRRHLVGNYYLARILFSLVKTGGLVVENNYWHSRLLLANALLQVFKRSRIVVTCHHIVYHDLRGQIFRKLDRILESLFLRIVDRVITVSDSTRREVISLGIPQDRIVVIPDGLDRPPQVTMRGDRQHLHVLFVGTCYQRKGIEYLLEAMRKLKRTDMVLDLVGDLDDDVRYSQCLQALTKEWNIQHKVIFHGRVPEDRLWELYTQADMFVLPSLWEGFGIVLLEAMAFGLPIVATNTGAIPELVKDDFNGILVPPADSEALSIALAQLAENPGKRERLGRNGRARSEQSLAWKEVGEKFARMLEELMMGE